MNTLYIGFVSDKSIPNVDSPLLVDDRVASELDKLGRLIDACNEMKIDPGEENTEEKSECQPPAPCHEFHTARLIFSHLGFLSSDNLQVA